MANPNKEMINIVNIADYQEGMPCHRYILRNLKNEVDALSFVKTFVNTMTRVGMSDEHIESCIYLFSAHLPPDSPLQNFRFENWLNMIDGISLVNCIRMDSTVATYKKCMQFYKSQSAKTDVCKICPLHRKYSNDKKDVETQILRFALESKSNYEYVTSLGILPMHFHSLVDILEHVTTATMPGIYSFYSDLFKALGYEHIAEAHYSNVDKTIPCIEIEKFISNKILNGSIPVSFISSPTFINKVIIILWDMIMESPLLKKVEIKNCINSLLSGKDEKRINDTTIAAGTDIGKGSVNEYYSVKPVDASARETKGDSSFVYESINLMSIFDSELLDEDKVSIVDIGIFSSDNDLPSNDADNAYNNFYFDKENALEVKPKDFSDSIPCTDLNGNIIDGENASDNLDDNNEIPTHNEVVADNKADYDNTENDTVNNSFMTTESGEIELRELPSGFDKEIYEEMESMVSVPFVPYDELSHFAICLDNTQSRLLTIFESHVLKDKRLCIELIQSEDSLRYFLMYSPKLHAYFYTNMTDHRVYEILKQLLSYSSIEKYCYFPFTFIAALMKFDIYVKTVFSIFSLSGIKMTGHNFSMEQTLAFMGAKKAVGGVTVSQEGTMESLPLLYMHSYPAIIRKGIYELKCNGFYPEFLERNQFDVILSRFYYQDLYENARRSLFKIVNSDKYNFAQLENNSYKIDGRCYTYRFVRCYEPAALIKKVIVLMDKKGYFKKYKLMVSSLTPMSFSVFIADSDQQRLLTLIHIAILEILTNDKYRDVEYELIE